MKDLELNAASLFLDWREGSMSGAGVKESRKELGALAGLFLSPPEDPGKVAYRVQWSQPVAPGTEGGLNWGVTVLEPGKVGEEYYMTHGHFHANASRAEYYGTHSGEGRLLLMGRDRKTKVEEMSAGSLHYISGDQAHRVVNVGEVPLVFWACWPSDAGYDYDAIVKDGFGVRVVEREGKPFLMDCR